jgi:hypothetical protein
MRDGRRTTAIEGLELGEFAAARAFEVELLFVRVEPDLPFLHG